ncbi:hypothetical protein Godav_011213, partial [Gossypium davidsonii]|nr:hypothetical protein [Gossypium davidsonii]
MSSLSENAANEDSSVEGLILKKVRFKDKDETTNSDMLIDSTAKQLISWRDKLVGHLSKTDCNGSKEKEDFDILEGDIHKSFVNGFLLSTFLIGFTKFSLENKVHSTWKPSLPFRLMDIENIYFFGQIQNKLDYKKAFPNVVMSWIRLLGLPGYLYKCKILTEIGGMVGKAAKLELHIDSMTRGRFARMVVYVNLDKPLVSQMYGHVKENCTFRVSETNAEKEPTPPEVAPKNHSMVVDGHKEKCENYRPWMLVERKSRRKDWKFRLIRNATKGKKSLTQINKTRKLLLHSNGKIANGSKMKSNSNVLGFSNSVGPISILKGNNGSLIGPG